MFNRGGKTRNRNGETPSTANEDSQKPGQSVVEGKPQRRKPSLRRSSSSPSSTSAQPKMAKSVANSFRWLPGNRGPKQSPPQHSSDSMLETSKQKDEVSVSTPSENGKSKNRKFVSRVLRRKKKDSTNSGTEDTERKNDVADANVQELHPNDQTAKKSTLSAEKLSTFERRTSQTPPTINIAPITRNADLRNNCVGLARLEHDDDIFSSDEKFVESSVQVDGDGNVVDNYGFVVTPASTVSPASASVPLDSQGGVHQERAFRKRQLRNWETFRHTLGPNGFAEMDVLSIQRWRRHDTGVDDEEPLNGSRPTSPSCLQSDEPSLEFSDCDGSGNLTPTIVSPVSEADVLEEPGSSSKSISGAKAGKGSKQRLKQKLGFGVSTQSSPRVPAKLQHSNARFKSIGSQLSRAVNGANLRMRRSASAANVPGVSFGEQHSRQQLTRLVRTLGIPPKYRADLWFRFSSAADKMANATDSESYDALVRSVQQEAPESAEVIERDLRRTFPTNSHFKDESVIGSLRRVLLAYSIRNPAVGYCQSMNFLVAILLLHMEEVQAFWMLCSIVEDLVPGYYTQTMACMHIDQHVLNELVQINLPKLHAHLNQLDFRLETTTYSWFLCLFVNTLPLESTLRVWDCFLHEGYKALFRVALAILKIMQKPLLAVDCFQDVYQLLSEMPRLIPPRKLFKVAYESYFLGSFSSSLILQLRNQYRPAVEDELRGLSTWSSFSSPHTSSSSSSTLDSAGAGSQLQPAAVRSAEAVDSPLPPPPKGPVHRRGNAPDAPVRPLSEKRRRAPRRLSTSTGFTYSYSTTGSPRADGAPRVDGAANRQDAARNKVDFTSLIMSPAMEPMEAFGFMGGPQSPRSDSRTRRLSSCSHPSDVTEGADLCGLSNASEETIEGNELEFQSQGDEEAAAGDDVPVHFSERLQSLAFVMNARQDPPTS